MDEVKDLQHLFPLKAIEDKLTHAYIMQHIFGIEPIEILTFKYELHS